MGVSAEQIKKSLRLYTPPSRRFETILNTKSLTIIDDYAHHPSAIKAIRESLEGSFQNKNVLFIDDSPQHIIGAKNIGINTHHLKANEDIITSFSDIIL